MGATIHILPQPERTFDVSVEAAHRIPIEERRRILDEMIVKLADEVRTHACVDGLSEEEARIAVRETCLWLVSSAYQKIPIRSRLREI